MIYHTPPECQGQIIAHSYMQVGDTLLRRTEDRSEEPSSPTRVQYHAVQLEDDEVDGIEPWTSEPAPRGEWRRITDLRAEQIEVGND